MRICKSLFLFMALCLLCGAGFTAQAQEYGRHPAYMRALSDLRLMRTYLDRMTPSERIDDDQASAIAEIDAAIGEIRQASINDGKDPNWRAPIDAQLTPADRWRHARESGNAAWHDLDQEEDNGSANVMKHRAMDHIEKANHIVDHIIKLRHYE